MLKKMLMTASVLGMGLAASSAHAESVSCVLENEKVLTLSNLSTAPVYSYGTAGNFEMVLPQGSAEGTVYKGEESFSGGGASYIAFTNGNYTYVAYSGIGRGWSFDGLRLYNGSELILEQPCKIPEAMRYSYPSINAPEDLLPY